MKTSVGGAAAVVVLEVLMLNNGWALEEQVVGRELQAGIASGQPATNSWALQP